MRTYLYFSSFLILLLLFISCENDIKEIKAVTDFSELPIQSVKESVITFTDSGRVQMTISSPLLERYDNKKEPYLEFKKGIHVLFYDKYKNVESSLDAEYAIYYENKELWVAQKNVEVLNRNGDIINTELLNWDRKKRLIYSDKFVKVTTPTEITYGEGFEADQNFNSYTIRKYTGEINLEE